MKKSFWLIKSALNKDKLNEKKCYPFVIDGKLINNESVIAIRFKNFVTNEGKDLEQRILITGHDISHFMKSSCPESLSLSK